MFSSRANYNKLKTNLRLCVQRLKLLERKKTELALKSRKEIADYISAGKEDRARIRVEHIIREDYMVEALEILELFCDLLLARFGLIETMAQVDEGLHEPIASIIWATPRLQGDIPEFAVVSKHLTAKYSPEFADACRKNSENVVNDKLMHKLSVHAPPKALIENYMIEISKSYNVPFEPDEKALMDEPMSDSLTSNLIDLGHESKEGYPGLNPLPPVPTGPNRHPDSFYPPPLPNAPPSSNSYPPPPPGGGASYPSPPPGGAPGGYSQPHGHAPVWNVPGNNPPAYNGSPHQPPQPRQSPPPAYSRDGVVPRGVMPPPSMGGPAPHDTLPELPNVPTPSASFNLPGMNSAGGEDVDFDDLTRRFEELKKKK